MTALAIEAYLRLLPSLKQTGQGSLWMSYDAEAICVHLSCCLCMTGTYVPTGGRFVRKGLAFPAA